MVNIESILLGEYAENELRKDFTQSERVAIGKQIEALLAGRRGSNQYRLKELPQNFGEALLGKETADVAAEKAGFGNPETYRQAKRVVEEGSPSLVAAMDEGLAPSAAVRLTKLTEAQIAKLRDARARAREEAKERSVGHVAVVDRIPTPKCPVRTGYKKKKAPSEVKAGD